MGLFWKLGWELLEADIKHPIKGRAWANTIVADAEALGLDTKELEEAMEQLDPKIQFFTDFPDDLTAKLVVFENSV